MIVKDIILPKGGFKLKACGDRYFQIAEPTEVRVITDIGELNVRIRPGFVTNFRSGGLGVDRFIDPIGDDLHQACWLVHDCNYTPCINKCYEHAIDRKTADDLLLAMLLFAGESKFKARVIWASVRVFGSSAYKDDDAFTFENYKRLEIYNTLRRIE